MIKITMKIKKQNDRLGGHEPALSQQDNCGQTHMHVHIYTDTYIYTLTGIIHKHTCLHMHTYHYKPETCFKITSKR